MFVAKPHDFGEAVELDGTDSQVGVQDLTVSGVELLQAQDYGEFGNPDGAAGSLGSIPGVMQVQGTTGRPGGSVSGRGMLQKTAVTSAPMSNPFPAPSSSVRTSPSSIKK